MLVDSNLIIYATQPPYAQLRSWFVNYATHYSVVSRLETLGYHQLKDAERRAIAAVLDNLTQVMLTQATFDIAITLRQRRKMSLGDVLIAATCLENDLPLATANTKDFDWIDELMIHNPMELQE